MVQILIVEDESLIAQDLQEILIGHGYHVPHTVGTGEEALKYVSEFQPDLVLMDIRLKGKLNGVEAATRIKKDFPSTAIIYLTSSTDKQTLQEAKTTQPLGYITKPFRETELLAMLEMAIYRNEVEKKVLLKQDLFKHILERTQDAIVILNHKGQIEHLNAAAKYYLQWESNTHPSPFIVEHPAIHPFRTHGKFDSLSLFLKAEHISVGQGEQSFHCHLKCSGLQNAEKQTQGHYLTFYPIEECTDAVEPRKKHIHICAGCKQIRRGDGHYQHFEAFFRDSHGLKFSHGMCSSCFSELYPNYQ